MTVDDAINGLKNLIVFMRFEDKMNEDKFNVFTYQSVDTGIKALEKQIPRKPDFTQDRSFALCPSCDGKGLHDKQIFCDNCGQKLDWSDKE
jgi:uncharacterized paraquat-inducible protein A